MRQIRILSLVIILFISQDDLLSQSQTTKHWSVKITGLLGQTTGTDFSAKGAGISLSRYFNLSEKTNIRFDLLGADLRGDAYLITDGDGNTIGNGRQAFLKTQINSLFQTNLWSFDKDTDIYVAFGPGLSYVYENTFEQINNDEFEGPDYKVFAFNALFELGIELPQFIFSSFISRSFYPDSSPTIDSKNLYIALSAGYRL